MLNTLRTYYNSINAGTFGGAIVGAAAANTITSVIGAVLAECPKVDAKASYFKVGGLVSAAVITVLGMAAGTEAYDDGVALFHEFATGHDITLSGDHSGINFPAAS